MQARTQDRPINVAFADDHTLVREGIGMLLERERDIRVVASVGSARDLLRVLRRQSADVALIDVGLSQLNGIDAIPELHRLRPGVRAVVLSSCPDTEYVYRAIRAGALGYVLKSAAPAELVAAIRAATAGHYYLSPESGRAVSAHRLLGAGPLPTPLEQLSRRERQVLQLVAEGHTSKQIAQLAGLSMRTVETYRARVTRKLGLKNLSTIVRYALRHGLIESA